MTSPGNGVRSPSLDAAAKVVRSELRRAVLEFGPMASPHEGWAVIQEEVDELWDEVKGEQRPERLREEAVQVAAMAMRFVLDCVPEDSDG